MAYVKFLIFNIGNRKYAIDLVHINGTEQGYNIIPFPDAPECVEGLINLRGKPVPVYSLRERFGLDKKIDDPGKSVLLARTSGIMIAYEVDSVDCIHEMDNKDIKEMPRMASNDETLFLNRVIQIGKDIVVVVDVNKVLSNEAIEKIEQLIEERTEAERKAEEERKAAELAAKEAEFAKEENDD